MKSIEKNRGCCLLDSVMTHNRLLTLCETNVHTISDSIKIIKGSRNAIISLPNDTILHLEDALLSSIYAKMGIILRH